MFSDYKIEHRDSVTFVHFSKRPNYGDAQVVLDDISANYPYEKRFYDFSDIIFDFTAEEIKRIAEYGKTVFLGPNAMAIYAPNDLTFGIMRAFEVYREQDSPTVARVFREKNEALVWLATQ